MERSTVPAAMLAAFGATDGDLATRLLAALVAAEGEGGDVRGRQSAALVVAPGPGDGSTPQPWARRFDVRVEDHRSPVDELARVLSVARAYEAMDEAEAAGGRGDVAAAAAASERSRALAPDDDQILLWHAVGLVARGTGRGGSRRAGAGLGGRAALPASTCAGSPSRATSLAATPSCGPSVSSDGGCAPVAGQTDATGRPEVGRGTAGRRVGGGSCSIVLQLCIRLFFSCSTASVLGAFGPAPRAFNTGILRVRGPGPHRRAWAIAPVR